MEFKIECPWCNQHYSVDESFVGQKVECSVCEKEFVVKKPNISVAVAKTKTVDFYLQKKKTNKPSVSANQKPRKRDSLSNGIIKRGIIAFAVLVIVLISVFVTLYIIDNAKGIPEKEYTKGLNAYKEHRYIEAVEHLQRAAERGYSEAQLILGSCYFNGDGVNRNIDEAVQWFRKAAEQNNIQAQFRLGMCYLTGIGVNHRENEAIFWLQKAAEGGCSDAQIGLGDLYFKEGERHDLSKALECYEKAGEQARSSRANEMAVCLLYTTVVEKANEGDAHFQFLAHEAYSEGKEGITKNDKEALKWLLKSANSGYSPAEMKLYSVYKDGMQGVPTDIKEATKWLKKAADHGHVEAQFLLGSSYYLGINGFIKDKTEGVKWFEKAANQGLDLAQLALGAYYVEQYNFSESVKWIQKAAEQGNVQAMSTLSECYKKGVGVDVSYEESEYWRKRALKANSND